MDELQTLEVGVDRVVRQAPLDLPGVRVGEEHFDREEVALRDVDDLVAIGTERGTQVQLPLLRRLVDHTAPVFVRRVRLLSGVREVGLEFVPPAVREFADRDLEDGLDRRELVGARREVQDPADLVVPERAADIGPEGVPVAVGEELRVAEVLDRGEPVLEVQPVPHPHRREGVDGSDREVLGHPLDEPQREPEGSWDIEAGPPCPLPRHVELEGVHQFVAEQMIRLVERHHHRHHEASLQDLGEALGPLVDELAGRVGLLEIRVVRVEDDRLPFAELVIEHPRQPRVPALGLSPDQRRGLGGLVVVIDVEVLRLEHLEIERPVHDFVSPEASAGLRLQRGRDGTCERRESGQNDERVTSPKHTSSTRKLLIIAAPGSWTPAGRVAPLALSRSECRKLPAAPGRRYAPRPHLTAPVWAAHRL